MVLGLNRDFEHLILAELCGVTAQQTAGNARET
jgi:hypothetical protein